MTGILLKLRRQLIWKLGNWLGTAANPFVVVRQNLIEKPEFQEALDAFDQGDLLGALEIYQALAEQGDAAAQHNLGIFYETGTGVRRQDDTAEYWYRKAAEQGLAEAQYQLATILAADAMAGLGEHDAEEESRRFIEAYMWLLLAEAQGHAQARQSLSRLEQHMSEDQLAEAKKRAPERSGEDRANDTAPTSDDDDSTDVLDEESARLRNISAQLYDLATRLEDQIDSDVAIIARLNMPTGTIRYLIEDRDRAGQPELFMRGNEEEILETDGYRRLLDVCEARDLKLWLENDYEGQYMWQRDLDLPSLAPTVYHVEVVIARQDIRSNWDGQGA